MKTITSLALVALGLSIPAAALAGANKTWVSGTGTDTGTCPITAPCASFQYAVDHTAAGGEVDVKDAGGYGTVIIKKAISIVADGVLASISVPKGGTGVTIAAGDGDVVALTGLTIDGHLLNVNGYVGGTGIVVNSSAIITKSTIRNLEYAIKFSGTGVITLTDSEISKTDNGLYITDNYSTVLLGNTRFYINGFGIVTGGSNVFSYGDNKFGYSTISGSLYPAPMK